MKSKNEEIKSLQEKLAVALKYAKWIEETPHQTDYEEDPCGQVNKMCELAQEMIKQIGEV